jgi:DNA-binding LytR/AlgR family response regulator
MKMLNELEILLVEDNQMHLDLLEAKLKGMEVQKIIPISTFKDTCSYLKTNVPDIIISDYYLDEGHTGADLIDNCLANKAIPLIFMSSFFDTDSLHYNDYTSLVGFLPKYASTSDIDKLIQIGLTNTKQSVHSTKIHDCIYVKHNEEIIKLDVSDIEYIAVDGKLLLLYVGSSTYIIRSALSDFYKKLPKNFLKIHQSYIINLKFLVSLQLEESVVNLTNASLPFSRDFKKDLLNAYYVA